MTDYFDVSVEHSRRAIKKIKIWEICRVLLYILELNSWKIFYNEIMIYRLKSNQYSRSNPKNFRSYEAKKDIASYSNFTYFYKN